jgi:hypothetical protein
VHEQPNFKEWENVIREADVVVGRHFVLRRGWTPIETETSVEGGDVIDVETVNRPRTRQTD